MTKILHIGQMIGGLDIYIRNTILYANKDCEYIIVHGESDNNKPVIKDGQAIKEYTITLYRNINLIRDFNAIIQAVNIVRKEKPNLIHCHSAKGGIVGRITGFLTGTPTLYTPHAFSFLSANKRWKALLFLYIERLTKFQTKLLACSESERQLGITKVHYSEQHSLVWHNAVPDAQIELDYEQ